MSRRQAAFLSHLPPHPGQAPAPATQKIYNGPRLPKTPGAQGTLFRVEPQEKMQKRQEAQDDQHQGAVSLHESVARSHAQTMDHINSNPSFRQFGAYLLKAHSVGNAVTAHTNVAAIGRDGQPLGQEAGHLDWYSGTPTPEQAKDNGISPGAIHEVAVRGEHQRKGVATEMLKFARDSFPAAQVRHSNALTADGKAWSSSKKVQGT
jgi:ribosomal protein S18 acetylase RimI-like enzyme